MTPQTYCRLLRLGSNPWHVRWLRRYAEQGVLCESSAIILTQRVPVFSLGPMAGLALPELGDTSRRSVRSVARILARPSAPHDLAAQWWAAGRPDPFACRALHRTDKEGTPDILETVGGAITAWEIERTQKSLARIYRALAAHLEALTTGTYTHVRYLFPTSALAATYQARFAEPVWPRYHYFAQQAKYHPIGDPIRIELDDPRRDQFTFESVSPLWPLML